MRKSLLLIACSSLVLSACNPVVCEPGGPVSGPGGTFCINSPDADLILFAALGALIIAASSRGGDGHHGYPYDN